jgi:hypothetical protein
LTVGRRTRIIAPAMPAESAFFFVIATLSASLAGLAGLVAALRRGTGLARLDLFRLREIVEFAFATILVSLATIPVSALVGIEGAVRIGAALALVVLVAHALLLARRAARSELERYRAWLGVAIGINAIVMILAVVTIFSASIAAYQLMLILLLARPMAAFLLVLSRFDAE